MSILEVHADEDIIEVEVAATDNDAERIRKAFVRLAEVDATIKQVRADAQGADQGIPIDKTLEHAKLDASKPAKKDEEEGGALSKIMAALEGLGERLTKLEKVHRTDAKRKDGENGEEGEEGEEGKGNDEEETAEGGMSRHEREGSKRVVADDAGDEHKINQWRVRADEVLGCFGQASPRQMIGETFKNYALRVLRSIQRHSERYKALELATLPPAAFTAIGDGILSDAEVVGRTGGDLADSDELVERKVRDQTGRLVSSFYGKNTFIRGMSARPRFVRSFLGAGGTPGAHAQ